MRRKLAGVALAAIVAGLVPGAGQASHGTVQVFLSSLRFCVTSPACAANENATIHVGDTVEYVYADALCSAFYAVPGTNCRHRVFRGSAPTFDSGDMPLSPLPSPGTPKPTFSKIFNLASLSGYTVICTVHQGITPPMTHKVIVLP